MRTLIGVTLLVTAVALLVRFVNLLDCGCADVVALDFWDVFILIVGGFAVMLPDREEF